MNIHARINRAVVKSSTSCGCIEINARNRISIRIPRRNENSMESHVKGELCPTCKEILLEE